MNAKFPISARSSDVANTPALLDRAGFLASADEAPVNAASIGQGTGPLHARLAGAMNVARYHGVDPSARRQARCHGGCALRARAGGMAPPVWPLGARRAPHLPSVDEDRKPGADPAPALRWWRGPGGRPGSRARGDTGARSARARRRPGSRGRTPPQAGLERRHGAGARRARRQQGRGALQSRDAHPPGLGREIDPARCRGRLGHRHHPERTARADDHDHAEYCGHVSKHEHAYADRHHPADRARLRNAGYLVATDAARHSGQPP